MTKEEATRILDPETSRDALWKYEDNGDRLEACNEACRVACAALRAQSAKLDRSRWEGCHICKDAKYIDGEVYVSCDKRAFRVYLEYDFCPCCGKPITEEAWAELELRIGGKDETV